MEAHEFRWTQRLVTPADYSLAWERKFPASVLPTITELRKIDPDSEQWDPKQQIDKSSLDSDYNLLLGDYSNNHNLRQLTDQFLTEENKNDQAESLNNTDSDSEFEEEIFLKMKNNKKKRTDYKSKQKQKLTATCLIET